MRRRIGYLILAVIMIIFNITAVIINFVSVKSQDSIDSLAVFSNDTSLSAHIIEITSIIMLVELVFSAIRIRIVRKRVSQSAVQREQE